MELCWCPECGLPAEVLGLDDDGAAPVPPPRGSASSSPTPPPVPILCDGMCRLTRMATNLAIDPVLLDRALAVSGEKTKKAAVTRALQEFIARREQKRLLELFGSLDWDVNYDYKFERTRG